MKVAELKTLNLKRLCAERGINATELGKILGATRQHGSHLLKGTSGLGDETMDPLCVKWGIDKSEFLKPLQDRKEGDEMERLLADALRQALDENAKLKAELLRITTGDFDRRKRGQA